MNTHSFPVLLAAMSLLGEPIQAQVVINEIMYHPPNDLEALQYVELHNAGKKEVDLAHWSFTKGIKFAFAEKTSIPAGGYLIVCRDRAAFSTHYGKGLPALGNFTGKLSHSGDKLELADAAQKVIDSVAYSDRGDWPIGPDGYSASLERISPLASGMGPGNWASSKLPAYKIPAGTPGKVNDSYATNLPPGITNVIVNPARPSARQKVTVTAHVHDSDGIKSVTLLYHAALPGTEMPEKEIAMVRVDGDEKSGTFRGIMDGQAPAQIIRYRIRATDTLAGVRYLPAPSEPRPTFSFATWANTNSSHVAFGNLQNIGAVESSGPYHSRNLSGPRGEAVPTRGKGAFIYFPPQSSEVLLFDHVRVKQRKGGFKVHFRKDELLREMSGINLIFEEKPRQVLTEPLSYEIYRLAGVPTEFSEHIRLWIDGQPAGYHELIEQPGKAFLTRHQRDDSGNLYKALWYGNGVAQRHEKKTNPTTGSDDLVKLVGGLNSRSGKSQWEFIQQNFNVPEVASYFAVNMCIQNWDGFFNNYYAYHDTQKTGKWEIYPWDEDKTWGDYDGASSRYDWYQLPLIYGSASDRPGPGSGIFGGPQWWRPPGFFSGPLLANPDFRKVFLARLQELCNNVFTEEKVLPFIAALEKRLEPEVTLRAAIKGEDARGALQRFRQDIQSLRSQLKERRKFLLQELARQKT